MGVITDPNFVVDLEHSRGEADQRGLTSGVRPLHNQRHTAELHNRIFGKMGLIKLGKIVYAIPYTHWYRVQVDDAGSEITACALAPQSVSPLSIRDTGPIAPNSIVLLWAFEGMHYGYILGVAPDQVSSDINMFSDVIEQGGNNGFHREQYYYALLSKCLHNANVMDFSNCRPLDGTAIGEWGRLNDLGMGFFLDNFLAFMRVDESAGLWLYAMDRYARLAAYNFNLETSGSEINARNDQNEFYEFGGSGPYPWETLGLFDPGDPRKETEDFAFIYTAKKGKFEPKKEDQQAFYRLEEYRGYLGQGWLRQMLLAPKDHPEINAYNDEQPRIGVFREAIGLDGSYSLTSAHSIHLAKRMLIPIPHRKRLPEDQKDGDGVTGDYDFSGLKGSHKVIDAPTVTEEPKNVLTAACLQETYAHLFNWKSVHPFNYHKGDFDLPEESELGYADKLQVQLEYNKLVSGDTWLEASEPKIFTVDHRYDAKYYETMAGFSVLPDGSLVFRDGYGSEIQMSGGNITISPAGTLWLRSGLSIVAWAGDDIVFRARNSVDLSSSKKDIRVKAEQNVEILAANGGMGRLLLENRATTEVHNYQGKVGEDIDEASGIIFKAGHSQVVALAQDIYLRTGGEEAEIGGGNIVIDADQGSSDIVTNSMVFLRKLNSSALDAFYENDAIKATNAYFQSLTMLDSPLIVDGSLAVLKDGILANGFIQVVGGHIATELAAGYDYKVPSLKDLSLTQAKLILAQDGQLLVAESQQADTMKQELLDDAYYSEDKIGNSEVEKSVQFSCRNEEQYNTEQLLLPETYWQHLIVVAGGGEPWQEPVVTYQDQELMPHPGKTAWTSDGFRKYEDKLFDAENGRDIDRGDDGSDYADPTLDGWQFATFEADYRLLS